VPVLVSEAGKVYLDSRSISEFIVAHAPHLVPSPLEGPVWAYADWCDQVLEDSCFKLAAPGVHRSFPRPADRALYALIKERKYGAGCIDSWAQASSVLLDRSRAALVPTERTLRRCAFLFGAEPTLADAALWGQLAMLRFGGIPAAALGESLPAWVARLEAAMATRRGSA
jgi:glutathione S-transferase